MFVVTSKLAPDLLGPIAVAAYAYMALVPLLQPPIMRALTTKEERSIVMQQLRVRFGVACGGCAMYAKKRSALLMRDTATAWTPKP